MKKLKIFAILLIALGFSSCKKYLSEPNRLQASITTVEQLQALLDQPNGITTYDFPTVFYSDDVYIDLAAYKAAPYLVNIIGLYYYTFNEQTMASNLLDYSWQMQWTAILNANLILANVDDVTGSTEAKNLVKASAYFNRAYAYFKLVNQYCQPYASSTLQSPGLPIRKTTSYDESLVRASLQDTYNFILSDIAQAQALVGNSDVPTATRWRISKTGIDAFLSRYYLFTGDYNKCLTHANLALASGNAALVDYNTIQPSTQTQTYNYQGTTYTVNYSALNQYTMAQMLQWQEFYYANFTQSPFGNWYGSPSLAATYDQNNDLRYKHFMPTNSGFTASWSLPGLYSYKMFTSSLPTGPTVAEVLLNKAEASARMNDFSTAITTVNLLRVKRFKTGFNATLSATDAATALNLVLQERRRELPFYFRFFDIRRFAYNENPSDDVAVSHTFYDVSATAVDQNVTKTFTLPVKSPRYAVPIPNADINASNGQLKQNTY